MNTKPPGGWPEDLRYITRNIYSKQLNATELEKIGVDKNCQPQPPAQKPSKLVKIRQINDPNHPAHGQNGLFAATKLQPKMHIIDYLGYVHPDRESDPSSDYDLKLDKETGVGVDAQRVGTEARMVNDYRGIMNRPNVAFDNRVVGGELRMAIFVAENPIPKGTELCINYGKGFWNARSS
jgi:SET domain-containing protein